MFIFKDVGVKGVCYTGDLCDFVATVMQRELERCSLEERLQKPTSQACSG